MEDAGGWVGKLSNPPQVNCRGKKLPSSVLERILCWFSHSVKARGRICRGRLRESPEVTPLLLILTFITYTHSVPRMLGTKVSHWVVVGRSTELGNWGRREAGQASKVQSRGVWPGQVRGIWAAATVPLSPGAASPGHHHHPTAPRHSSCGSQLSECSFSQLCSSSVSPRPCLSETAPPCVSPCPCPVLSHLSPDLHLNPCSHPCLTPGLLCLHASLTLFLHPLSVSLLSCLLCLCLVPISIPAFLLHALQLCLHLCPCGDPLALVSNLSLSPPCLILVSICVPVSLLSLFPALFLSLFLPASSLHPRPHPRLRLFLVRVSIPLLGRLCGPRRDGTSLGAGPRGWIRITRLSRQLN